MLTLYETGSTVVCKIALSTFIYMLKIYILNKQEYDVLKAKPLACNRTYMIFSGFQIYNMKAYVVTMCGSCLFIHFEL